MVKNPNLKITMLKQQPSLSLQLLVFLNWHYLPFYFVLNLALFTFKSTVFRFRVNLSLNLFFLGVSFFYPGRLLGWELTSLFCFVAIEYCRLHSGKISMAFPILPLTALLCPIVSKGNKLLQSTSLALSMLFAVPTIVLYSYYMDLQTYV